MYFIKSPIPILKKKSTVWKNQKKEDTDKNVDLLIRMLRSQNTNQKNDQRRLEHGHHMRNLR